MRLLAAPAPQHWFLSDYMLSDKIMFFDDMLSDKILLLVNDVLVSANILLQAHDLLLSTDRILDQLLITLSYQITSCYLKMFSDNMFFR
jgi:hypothetical protein